MSPKSQAVTYAAYISRAKERLRNYATPRKNWFHRESPTTRPPYHGEVSSFEWVR